MVIGKDEVGVLEDFDELGALDKITGIPLTTTISTRIEADEMMSR